MAPRLAPSGAAFAVAVAALFSLVAALDLEARCKDMAFCLTSFRWCDTDTDKGNCEYPDDVYPLNVDSNVGRAALLYNHDYELSWKGTKADHDVLLRWTLEGGPHKGETRTWQKNITKGETSYKFKFDDMLKEFDEDMDRLEVLGYATTRLSKLLISQPSRTDFQGDEVPYDESNEFLVVGDWASEILGTQRRLGREAEAGKWRRNVAIGVGVGGALLVAICLAAGFFLGKRTGGGRRASRKNANSLAMTTGAYNRVPDQEGM